MRSHTFWLRLTLTPPVSCHIASKSLVQDLPHQPPTHPPVWVEAFATHSQRFPSCDICVQTSLFRLVGKTKKHDCSRVCPHNNSERKGDYCRAQVCQTPDFVFRVVPSACSHSPGSRNHFRYHSRPYGKFRSRRRGQGSPSGHWASRKASAAARMATTAFPICRLDPTPSPAESPDSPRHRPRTYRWT